MLFPICSVAVVDGLLLEPVDDEPGIVVTAHSLQDAPGRRFTNEAAERLESVQRSGGAADLADDALTAALVNAGVLTYRARELETTRDFLSRRGALGLIGGAVGVGLSSLVLPTAAAAASVGGGGPDGAGEPGLLTVSVFAGTDGTNRQFSIYWEWAGPTAPSSTYPYSYTIDPGITRSGGSVTSSGTNNFNAGLQFFYPIDVNSGQRVVTVTWFGVTKTVTIADITATGSATA